jgi:hypothetical protein
MNKLYLFILVIIPFQVVSQLQQNDCLIGASFNYIKFEEFNPKNSVGIHGEYMLGKRLGVEFSVAGGKDYFQMGTGAILFPLGLLLSKADNDGGGGLLLLLFTVASLFEHTNYHIPLTPNLELVPFVSLLNIRYIYDEGHPFRFDTFPSWSVGTKLSLITKTNWYVHSSIEVGKLYHTGRPKGYQAGIHLGRVIKSKHQE